MPNESIYIAGPSVRNDPRVQTPILPLAGEWFNGEGLDAPCKGRALPLVDGGCNRVVATDFWIPRQK